MSDPLSSPPHGPPPLPGSVKKQPPLGILLGIVAAGSMALALVLAALFWFLGNHPTPWMTEHFFNQPLGFVDPFEAYTQITSTEPTTSEGTEAEAAVELGSRPANLWDRWVLAEYLSQTGKENPYLTHPSPQSPEELSQRRAAFALYDKTMETEREGIEASVNVKAFLFDLTAYFLIFALVSSIFVVLLCQSLSPNRRSVPS